MSNSKFSGILAQARNRRTEEEAPADENISSNEPPQAAEVVTPPQGQPELIEASKSLPLRESIAEPTATKRQPKAQASEQRVASKQDEPRPETIAPTIEQWQGSPVQEETQRRRPAGKRSDPNYTQITAYITKSTHRGVKLALLQQGEGREISEVVEECLQAWLNSKNPSV